VGDGARVAVAEGRAATVGTRVGDGGMRVAVGTGVGVGGVAHAPRIAGRTANALMTRILFRFIVRRVTPRILGEPAKVSRFAHGLVG